MKKYYIYLFSLIAFIACTPDSTIQKASIDYVDPFIGTGFHGHTYPGATAPFGAVQLSPDTRFGNWDACSGYHYDDTSLWGFSHTHLSGTGCIDLGDILFHPTTKAVTLRSDGYIFEPLAFSHEKEEASPGYYSVELDEGIKVELTATTYAGMHKYTFEEGENQTIIIDLNHRLTNETIDTIYLKKTKLNEVVGMRRTQGWVENQTIYFVAQFSENFQSVEFVDNGSILKDGEQAESQNQQVILTFGKASQTPIIVKVGLSIVSEDNARENLIHDISDFDFDAVKEKTHRQWIDALSDITVEGGSVSELKNFYTALYHTKIVPNIVSDVNGQYRKNDMFIIGQLPEGQKHYSTFSLWDTFRAWNPLMTLIDTTFVADMIHSYLDMYDATGELPIWSLSAGETYTMIGYHAVSVIVDAYMKGIRGFDVDKAYEAMKVSSNINKKGSDYYVKNGFIPSNIKKESVSCLLEYAYDDWAVAQMAKALGHDDDYKTYSERALNYINVFDGHTKFFRGKRVDGNWDSPFNPLEPGRAYTEANAWQYRFFVPHDVNGLIQLFGGQYSFIEQLDRLFLTYSKIDGDMVDMTGMIGQYVHGNEPSHHMAYLYNYVGQPWKTQEMTRRILTEMYQPTPEGIIGNEDCGQMSAWYILTALGIYPVCPGSNQFALTSPLFEKATIRLANGKVLEIKANEPQNNTYIEKVALNGKEVSANFITYDQLMEGGVLDFTLVASANKTRGTSTEEVPYSKTKEPTVSIPYTTKDLNFFVDSVRVDLLSATEGAKIYYTLNGLEPDVNAILYIEPFQVATDVTIKAKAMKEGFLPSRTFSIEATKAHFLEPMYLPGEEQGTNFEYYEGYYSSVYDIHKSLLKERGTMPEPSIEGAKRNDHFAYIFSGFIFVPDDGVYEFMTKSDDGSVLYVANQKVVDNDGSHAAISATGRIVLKRGYHTYRLLYFEDYEGQDFSWKWKTRSSSIFEAIPTSKLYIR